MYYEKPNGIDKYFRRGKLLNDITSSHMIKMYDPARVNIFKTRRMRRMKKKRIMTLKLYTKEGFMGKALPNIVELKNPYPQEPRYLKKRKQDSTKSSKIAMLCDFFCIN